MATSQKDLTAGKKAAAVAAVNDWIKVGPLLFTVRYTIEDLWLYCSQCRNVAWLVWMDWVLRGSPSRQLLV